MPTANPYEQRRRTLKINRMCDLLSGRAAFSSLPLTRELDRMTPAEREHLDAVANPRHPASADTWEELRAECVRRDGRAEQRVPVDPFAGLSPDGEPDRIREDRELAERVRGRRRVG